LNTSYTNIMIFSKAYSGIKDFNRHFLKLQAHTSQNHVLLNKHLFTQ